MKKKSVHHIIEYPHISQGFTHEMNDCAVRALAYAFGVDYDYAHRHFAALGRKDRKPTPVAMVRRLLGVPHMGHEAKRMPHIGVDIDAGVKSPEITIATFCKQNPKGSFYCFIRGHAFAVVDGSVKDTGYNRPGRRIFEAYKVEKCD